MFKTILSGDYVVPGLGSLEPWMIDRVRILQGSGPVAVNASLSKVKIIGFSKLILVENQVSSKDYSWITISKIPKIRIEANYQMNGRVLVIPLNVGHGIQQ
jgi:Haemolymph juvenile hormone binding protein (JHBP)